MNQWSVMTATEQLGHAIIGAAMEVHTELGPGLYERVYAVCLADELRARGMAVQEEVAIPVRYRGRLQPLAYRVDLFVERTVIIEVKTVSKLADIHETQLRTYLRLTAAPLGILFNFSVSHLRHGYRKVLLEQRGGARPT